MRTGGRSGYSSASGALSPQSQPDRYSYLDRSAVPSESRFADLYSKMDDMQAAIQSTKSLFESSGAGGGGGRSEAGASAVSAGVPANIEVDPAQVAAAYKDPEIDLSVLPIADGYLNKKGGGFGGMRSWRKRYFRVYSTSLYYFKSDTDMNPSGQFTISPYTQIELGTRCGPRGSRGTACSCRGFHLACPPVELPCSWHARAQEQESEKRLHSARSVGQPSAGAVRRNAGRLRAMDPNDSGVCPRCADWLWGAQTRRC